MFNDKKYRIVIYWQLAEILLMDECVVVFRNAGDAFFYVTGGPNENELILLNVLNGLYDTLAKMIR